MIDPVSSSSKIPIGNAKVRPGARDSFKSTGMLPVLSETGVCTAYQNNIRKLVGIK